MESRLNVEAATQSTYIVKILISDSKIYTFKKKFPVNQIQNYRPTSVLILVQSFFEKLILQLLVNIKTETKVDLSGNSQPR